MTNYVRAVPGSIHTSISFRIVLLVAASSSNGC